MRRSGSSEVFKVIRDTCSTTWVIHGEAEKRRTVEKPLQGGTFVIDRKTGGKLAADRTGLEACLQPLTSAADRHGILVVAGEEVVKSIADITGDRIGKAEWATEAGMIQCVNIVERMGAPYTSSNTAIALLMLLVSRLSCSCRFHQQARDIGLFTSASETVASASRSTIVRSQVAKKFISCITHIQELGFSLVSSSDTGNLIDWIRHTKTKVVTGASYASHFGIRGAYPQLDIDLESTRPIVPRRPQQVSLGPSSVLDYLWKFGTSMTGENVDALCEITSSGLGDELTLGRTVPVAGPDRPQPVRIVEPTSGNSDGDASETPQTGLYDRLTSALNERGSVYLEADCQVWVMLMMSL